MSVSSRSPILKCTNDHDYTPANTLIGADGKRRCRECQRVRDRNRKITPERKDYKRRYQAEWIARRRAEFFADKACVKCGSTSNLELDHIDPALKVSHNVWSWSEKRRLAEIAKCQPLCGRCHKEKTHSWVDGKQPHGRYMYEHKGCRCDTCVDAVRARKRRQAVQQRATRKRH